MDTIIDIRGINKAAILVALYNASKAQGFGVLDPNHRNTMSLAEAEEELQRTRFMPDYVRGRVIKTDLDGDQLDPRLFDRDNGDGAALRALQPLLSTRVHSTNDKRANRIARLAAAYARQPDRRKLRRIDYIWAKIQKNAHKSR
jgi:hypothetical protein